jgi:CheY-like chemotaxis protein
LALKAHTNLGETVNKLHVLIVEDEVFSAMELEQAVTGATQAECTTRTSLAAAEAVLDRDFDFAFLDIEVTNGRTFEIAKKLARKLVPFAFVSGLQREEVPIELRQAPFISKPFRHSQIANALFDAIAKNND